MNPLTIDIAALAVVLLLLSLLAILRWRTNEHAGAYRALLWLGTWQLASLWLRASGIV